MESKLLGAILLSIEVWEELAKTGDTKSKLPVRLFHKIEDMRYFCPLCTHILGAYNVPNENSCAYCPLENCNDLSNYAGWLIAIRRNKKNIAKHFAQKIVDKLKDYFIYKQMYIDYTEIEMREG